MGLLTSYDVYACQQGLCTVRSLFGSQRSNVFKSQSGTYKNNGCRRPLCRRWRRAASSAHSNATSPSSRRRQLVAGIASASPDLMTISQEGADHPGRQARNFDPHTREALPERPPPSPDLASIPVFVECRRRWRNQSSSKHHSASTLLQTFSSLASPSRFLNHHPINQAA